MPVDEPDVAPVDPVDDAPWPAALLLVPGVVALLPVAPLLVAELPD